ncbi:MAG: serine/threonine protein kinase [Candidatus Obscuribacterales bacterium]
MNKREAARKEIAMNCPHCGRNRSKTPHGSLSGWLFRSCTCELSAVGKAESHGEPESLPTLPENFELVRVIGRGGMGTVLQVKERVTGEHLALKLLHAADDPMAVKRFEQEAASASVLDHPNLVAVKDYGMLDEGSPYLTMEYTEGETLSEIIERQVFLDEKEAMEIFIQIGNAMAHAHSRGVIHRDLKPGNIIVEQSGGYPIVKIVDFGIARQVDGSTLSTITRTGEVFGSPEYMSPEQCRGDLLDQRTDIYSLGCVMYECLTGRSAFAAPNPVKVILKQLHYNVDGFRRKYRTLDISESMESIVCHCLAKNPDERYQHMAELVKDLEFVFKGEPPLVLLDQVERAHRKSDRLWQIALMLFAVSFLPYLYLFESFDTVTAVIAFAKCFFMQTCIFVVLYFVFRVGTFMRALSSSFKKGTNFYAGDGWLNLLCSCLILESLGAAFFALLFLLEINGIRTGIEVERINTVGLTVLVLAFQFAFGGIWLIRRARGSTRQFW